MLNRFTSSLARHFSPAPDGSTPPSPTARGRSATSGQCEPLLSPRAGRPAASNSLRPGRIPAPALSVLRGADAQQQLDVPLRNARRALDRDDASTLQQLLRKYPDLLVLPVEDKGDTLLTAAARAGKTEAVLAIVMQARGAGDDTFKNVINHRTADGSTALTLSIEGSKLDMAKLLLSHGEVAEGNAELVWALGQGRVDVAQSLAKHGRHNTTPDGIMAAAADASEAMVRGDTVMHDALLRQTPAIEVVMLHPLLRQTPEILMMEEPGSKETLLTEAAAVGNEASVRTILAQASLYPPSCFADILNHRNADGDTALAQAIRYDHLDVASSLLAHKQIDVNLANHGDLTPLHRAATAENPRFAAQLLDHPSIRANPVDANNNTPLHLAIASGCSNTAVAIAGHTATSPDEPNRHGKRALAMAIDAKDLLVIDALVNHAGVDPNRTDSRDRTLLWQQLINWKDHLSPGGPESGPSRWGQVMGTLAASSRVNSNQPDSKGQTPLSKGQTPLTFLSKLSYPSNIAVGPPEFNQWRNNVVKAMLEGGRRGGGQLDPQVTNADGETPRQVALAQNNDSLIKIFDADAEARGQRRPQRL
jgi:ankyrin repeat protein